MDGQSRGIGAPIRRNEDPRLLRGLGSFVDDLDPAGVLHAAILRSPYGHARIRGIDATRARTMPGVHAIYTAAGLGPQNQPAPLVVPHPSLTHGRTQTPLATDEVRFIGEAVAVVVADSRYLAEDAANGAPLVHADVPNNVAARFAQIVGDPDAAFAQAAHVFKERLFIERSCG